MRERKKKEQTYNTKSTKKKTEAKNQFNPVTRRVKRKNTKQVRVAEANRKKKKVHKNAIRETEFFFFVVVVVVFQVCHEMHFIFFK